MSLFQKRILQNWRKKKARKNSCQTNFYRLVCETKIGKSRKRKNNEKTYKKITYKKYIRCINF